MHVDTVSFFFALLTIGAVVAIVGVASAFIVPRGMKSFRTLIVEQIRPYGLWFAWFVALVSMLGSLYYSEIAHFAPCNLCWYQRIAVYPLAVILLIAAWRDDRRINVYAWPLTGIGAAIAIYQYLIQAFPSLETPICGFGGVSCTDRWIWEFGFVSFPFMSLVSFALIAGLLYIAKVDD